MNDLSLPSRRNFLGAAAATFSAAYFSLPQPAQADSSDLNILGPRAGYSPQIGTFVSLFTWMRDGNGVLAATRR